MDLFRALGPMARQIAALFSRGLVSGVSPGKLNRLQLRLLADEAKDGVEHFEPFGLASHPLPGAEAAAAFIDGDRSHGLVLVVADRRYRLQGLAAGEVALHDAHGNAVHLKADGAIEITAALKVSILSPLVECAGNLAVAGNITAAGMVSDGAGSVQAMRDAYNNHAGHNLLGSTPDVGM